MLSTITPHLRTLSINAAAAQEGQTLVEYGLIILFVAVVLVGALVALNVNLTALLNTAGSAVNP